MSTPPRALETFAMLKPSGVHQLGNIVTTTTGRGKLRLVELYRVDKPSREVLEAHYAEHKEKAFFDPLVEDMLQGPLIPMIWGLLPQVESSDPEADATQIMRSYVGPTDPLEGDPDYHIRANFGVFPPEVTKDSRLRNNVIHAAANLEDAIYETSLWFPHRHSTRTPQGLYVPKR